MPRKSPDALGILSKKMLKFIDAWQGDALAAASAAGYSNPKSAACKLMQNDAVMIEIRRKQRVMTEESGKRLSGQLIFDRSHVLNRLWEIAQIAPEDTNKNLGAQVKAAEALGALFDAELKYIAQLLPHLPTKSKDEIQFFIRHGHFPQHPGESQ
jgi:phage terminase small subunit